MERERSAGELEFINQKARQLMVEVAEDAVYRGFISDLTQARVGEVYLDHMKAKGWLTKRLPITLTATGWGIASAFLKR